MNGPSRGDRSQGEFFVAVQTRENRLAVINLHNFEFGQLMFWCRPRAKKPIPQSPDKETAADRQVKHDDVRSIQQNEIPLPTCYIPLKELGVTSKGALVAKLVSVGSPELGPVGAADYSSKWKTAKVLRGDYAGEVELDFRVQTIPEEHRQRMPEVGKTYILICYDINARQIAYVFDYTDAKLRN